MASPEKEKHKWFWIALILLLLWWWWWKRRKRPAPIVQVVQVPVVDTFTPDPSSGLVSEGTSYATIQGNAPGTATAASMQRDGMAPESVDMLNAVNWIDANGVDSGWPLFDTWESAYRDTHGDLTNETVATALAQLQERLTSYVAGQISHYPPYQTL